MDSFFDDDLMNGLSAVVFWCRWNFFKHFLLLKLSFRGLGGRVSACVKISTHFHWLILQISDGRLTFPQPQTLVVNNNNNNNAAVGYCVSQPHSPAERWWNFPRSWPSSGLQTPRCLSLELHFEALPTAVDPSLMWRQTLSPTETKPVITRHIIVFSWTVTSFASIEIFFSLLKFFVANQSVFFTSSCMSLG